MSAEQILTVNDVPLCVQTFGSSDHPAVLLMHGASASMLWWEEEFCEKLAAGGRFVIRYDQRDTGRSITYPPGLPGYRMTDLAEDALGVLDALGVARAHVVGRSMSGGLAIILAVDHPDRTASLTLIGTTDDSHPYGEPDLPGPPAQLDDGEQTVEYIVNVLAAYSGPSPHFDRAATTAIARRDVQRANDIAATLSNHFLLDGEGPQNGWLGDVTMPTLVVHGELDPLFPPPHAHSLHAAIAGSELLMLADTGHEVPSAQWGTVVDALIRHTAS